VRPVSGFLEVALAGYPAAPARARAARARARVEVSSEAFPKNTKIVFSYAAGRLQSADASAPAACSCTRPRPRRAPNRHFERDFARRGAPFRRGHDAAEKLLANGYELVPGRTPARSYRTASTEPSPKMPIFSGHAGARRAARDTRYTPRAAAGIPTLNAA
jgi:hypothetical protein